MSFWEGFEKRADHQHGDLTNQSVILDPSSECHKTASVGKTIKKTIGKGIIGTSVIGGLGISGYKKLTTDPDMQKNAFDQKEKIRNDIRKYENEKKKRKIYGAGRMAAVGVAGLGGLKKNPLMFAGGMGGAFGAGFMRGKAAREEQSALNRIKRHYDLRDNSNRLINFKAVIPETEKVAIVADIIDLAMSGVNHFMHTGLPLVAHGGPLTQLGVDIATLPYFARGSFNKLKNIASIAAKNSQGVPITGGEKMLLSAADFAKGMSDSNKQLLPSLYSKANDKSRNMFSRALYSARHKINKPPLAKYVNSIPSSILSTMSTGKHVGEIAGNALTQVRKISPEHADLGLKAMEGGLAPARLVSRLQTDAGALSKAWETFSNDTLIGKMIKRRGEAGGSSMLQRYARDPNKAMEDVQKIQRIENNLANAGKAVVTSIAAGIGGNVVGEYRERHPLSKNDLPSQIAKKREPGLTGSLFG